MIQSEEVEDYLNKGKLVIVYILEQDEKDDKLNMLMGLGCQIIRINKIV